MTAVILAGCTSESLSNVYLLSLSYTGAAASSGNTDPAQLSNNVSTVFASLAGNAASLEVRAGYLGLCMLAGSGGWVCSTNGADLAVIVREAIPGVGSSSDSIGDPLNLIYLAQNFKDSVIFVGLL